MTGKLDRGQKLLLYGAAAGALLGGAYWFYRYRSQHSSDDIDFEEKPLVTVPSFNPDSKTNSKVHSDAEKKSSEPPAPQKINPVKEQGGEDPQDSFTKEYSFKITDDNEQLIEEALLEQEAAARVVASHSSPKSDGSVSFASVGITLTPEPGWVVQEEHTMATNLLVISVSKPEFIERQRQATGASDMGNVPLVLFTVEDVSGDALSLGEYKERSRAAAIQQMMMMSNGMVPPRVLFDDDLVVGSFLYCFEFAQSMPPYLDMRVLNLITVKNGFAYVFQLMCKPAVLDEYKATFMTMARSVKIDVLAVCSQPYTDIAYLDVSLKGLSFKMQPKWSAEVGTSSIVEITTSSQTKTEAFSLYKRGTVPSAVVNLPVASKKEVNGVSITTLTDGRKSKKSLVFGDFEVIQTPLKGNHSVTDEGQLVCLIKSISETSSSPNTMRYVSLYNGKYSFDLEPKGRLMVTNLSRTVVYSPTGRNFSPEENPMETPSVTIRQGNPAVDSDCFHSLEEWHMRLQDGADGAITDLKKCSVAGHDALTFCSKDMQEIGQGQRVEVYSKVHVLVTRGETLLIRWETTTGNWKRYERKLEALISSVKFEC